MNSNLGPRTVTAVVRHSLDDIDSWLANGVSREEIAAVLAERYQIEISLLSLKQALYRVRKEASKTVLHNTSEPKGGSSKEENVLHNTEESVLHNTERRSGTEPKNPPVIIGKEFFDEANAEFNPDDFIKKY